MKKAFTMIELIFVIVILGILAAVALPKFIGVANQAHEANLKSFVATLNRTVGASLWSQSLSDGKGGHITSYTKYDDGNFSKFIDIPKEINESSIKLENCGTNSFGSNPFAEANVTVTGVSYKVYCRDGNATNPPAWVLVNNGGTCIAGPCDEYNK